MLAPTPNTAATLVQLLATLATCSALYHRRQRRIRLQNSDDIPSEEEMKLIALSKELDGDAIDQKRFDQRIRLTRSFLVLLSIASLSLIAAEAAYTLVNEWRSLEWKHFMHSQSLLGSELLLWSLALHIAYARMGAQLWLAILAYASLAATASLVGLSLLVIPEYTATITPLSLYFLAARFAVSIIATTMVSMTPSGPTRQRQSREGAVALARIGSKGRTILSSLWFTHAFPVIRSAQRKGQLDESDASQLGSDMSGHLLHLRFSSIFKRSQREGKPKRLPTATLKSCWTLLRTIILANKTLFILNQTLSAVSGVMFYVPMYTTFRLIAYLEDQQRDDKMPSGGERLRYGVPYCLLLAGSILITGLMMGQLMTVNMQWLRNCIKTQLNTAIFAKSLRRKDTAGLNADTKEGDDGEDKEGEGNASFASKTQVVNLASVDSERVANVIYLISFSMAPIEILTGGYFAISLLGWGAVIGLAASFVLQPLIFYFGKVMAGYQGSQQAARDRKVTLLNEVFHAIRMVKFNAWEKQTSARVELVRDEELNYQRLLFMIEVAQYSIFVFSPIVVILVAYGWFTLVDKKPLTPSVAFTAMSVLEEMRFSLTHIPEGLSQLIQTLVSVQRIQQYLESDEVTTPEKSQSRQVSFTHATIEWPKMASSYSPAASPAEEMVFELRDLDIEFIPNALNLVVGKIGAGKTLLLKALLGEAEITKGSVSCPNSVPTAVEESCPTSEDGWLRPDQCVYVPQTAFLINATLRDNILFGLPLLESRYQAVLHACGLLPDLKVLEDGDETEIGENGIGLSGGQKIRVTLARAAYGRGATVLLDDCLSAVDAHTADHIHRQLLKGPLLAHRTVVMITHQVQLIAQSADKVIMLEGGTVKFQGDPLDFMNSDLYHGLVEEQEAAPTDPVPSEDVTPATTAPSSPQGKSMQLTKDAPSPPPGATPLEAKKSTPRKLVDKEVRAKGAVLLSIYGRYISAAGGAVYAVFLVSGFVISNGFEIVTSRWLQYWSSDVLAGQRMHSDLWWISAWAGLWGVNMVLMIFTLLLLYYGSLRASRRLFKDMLHSILHAPLRFHDTVSRGRLLNRFGYDFEEMDSEMADVFQRMGDEFIAVLVNFFVVATGGGITFVVVFALMIPLYVLVGRLYMTAVRDMKRLSSTTRSPILNTFSDVVSGVSVIRAFGASSHFFKTLVERIELNVTFAFWTNELRWWYELLFNTFSSLLILVAAFIILLNPKVGAAQAAFVFSFLIRSNIHILFCLKAYTNMEQKLVSVERIVEYTALEQEGTETKTSPVPAAWPYAGAVEVEDLRVRYAKDLPDVLKGINLSVPGGAKVGVVGHTGCGKSTLASSFFRFVEASAGSIYIDGIDISTIALSDLRSRLQIVPQDPIILSGPLRTSVDVQNEYSDEEVRKALRDVQLLKEGSEGGATAGDATPTTRAGMHDLQHAISEGGSNLSNGEKQLLCLARAILQKARLIIFDEATSSVDFDTDQLISQTIREAFAQSTVITIAHRLRTIMHYDLVVVMDDGQVVEFDSPRALLAKAESRFYRLCKASGRRELAHLKTMAGLV